MERTTVGAEPETSARPVDAAIATPPLYPAADLEIDDSAWPLLDSAALDCARQIVAWAPEHAPDYGVRFVRARLCRWHSIEDPEWVQLVINVWVSGDPDAAMAFWDVAGDKLMELAARQPTPATELLMLSVRWR